LGIFYFLSLLYMRYSSAVLFSSILGLELEAVFIRPDVRGRIGGGIQRDTVGALQHVIAEGIGLGRQDEGGQQVAFGEGIASDPLAA